MIPSLTSITTMPISAMLPPLFLKFEKAECPGLSINRKPGILILYFMFFNRYPAISSIFSIETLTAYIVCVILPASFWIMFMPEIDSIIWDFP